MIDLLLEPIYTTQKRLDENAHHSLKEYIENAHCSVQEMIDSEGVNICYGSRIGGYETVSPPPFSKKKPRLPVEA